jgi:hypothetical protein
MTVEDALHARRPQRVMVEPPEPSGGVGDALKGTFRLVDDLPQDISRALDRLRGIA